MARGAQGRAARAERVGPSSAEQGRQRRKGRKCGWTGHLQLQATGQKTCKKRFKNEGKMVIRRRRAGEGNANAVASANIQSASARKDSERTKDVSMGSRRALKLCRDGPRGRPRAAQRSPGYRPEIAGDRRRSPGDRVEIARRSPEVAGDRPEIAWRSPEIAGDRPEIARRSPEIAPGKP